jgi:hypothetical protein
MYLYIFVDEDFYRTMVCPLTFLMAPLATSEKIAFFNSLNPAAELLATP